MPLMQLSTLVLPAPLGPMSANSSPAATAIDTSSSTVRPPKRRRSRSTARSAIPSPAAAILLHVAIAPARAADLAEVELLDVGVIAQALGAAVENDAAVLHHIGMVGDGECEGGALLDQDDGEVQLAADVDEALQEIFDHDWRKAKGQLVHQQELRRADQRAAQRQ